MAASGVTAGLAVLGGEPGHVGLVVRVIVLRLLVDLLHEVVQHCQHRVESRHLRGNRMDRAETPPERWPRGLERMP